MSKNGLGALAAGIALGATNAYLLKKREEDRLAKKPADPNANPTDQRLADGTQTAPGETAAPAPAMPAAGEFSAGDEYAQAWKSDPPAPDAQPLPFVGSQE